MFNFKYLKYCTENKVDDGIVLFFGLIYFIYIVYMQKYVYTYIFSVSMYAVLGERSKLCKQTFIKKIFRFTKVTKTDKDNMQVYNNAGDYFVQFG